MHVFPNPVTYEVHIFFKKNPPTEIAGYGPAIPSLCYLSIIFLSFKLKLQVVLRTVLFYFATSQFVLHATNIFPSYSINILDDAN